MNEHQEKFSIHATFDKAKGFEIFGITAGDGNGWHFGAAALQKSLPLWDGIESFVDHTTWMDDHHSVRDLCGVCRDPQWDEVRQGVKLNLRPIGPSAPLLIALGNEMLAEKGAASSTPTARIGFSCDVIFTAKEKDVQEILRVMSLDLVFDPARGGAFIRALNSVADVGRSLAASTTDGGNLGDGNMSEQLNNSTPATVPASADVEAMRQLLNVQQEQQKLAAEQEAAKQVRVQMCAYLLDAGLAGSKLPTASQDSIRKQFTGKVFEAAELNAAIDDARKLISELTGAGTVAGMSVASQMFNTRDQLQAAVDDMFEVERDKDLAALRVAKLSGIRELYHGMTGDLDFHGGYDLTRAKFQATTTTFAGLVKNAMNKALIDRWTQLGRVGYDWWNKVATVEHFSSLNDITWLIFGTIASLPSVAEGAEYAELKIGDSPETSSFTKYGGFVGVTLEAIDRDDTRKLKAIPRELASAAIRNISEQVAAIFSASTYVGPTLADTGALFNSTAVTTKGGHANLTSTALGTDYTAWEVTAKGIYNQPLLVANETSYYGTGKKMAIDPTICLVNRTLKSQAEALFLPRWASQPHTSGSVPTSGGLTWGGRVDVVTVPEWASTTAWFGVVDPKLVPAVMIGERFGIMPEIYIAGDENSPAMFSNDESRMKVRHFLAVGVGDFRPLSRGNA